MFVERLAGFLRQGVQALAGLRIELRRRDHVASSQVHDAFVQQHVTLHADAHRFILTQQVARAVVLPADLSGGRIECVDVGSVVADDPRRTVGDSLGDHHSAGHRPG